MMSNNVNLRSPCKLDGFDSLFQIMSTGPARYTCFFSLNMNANYFFFFLGKEMKFH